MGLWRGMRSIRKHLVGANQAVLSHVACRWSCDRIHRWIYCLSHTFTCLMESHCKSFLQEMSYETHCRRFFYRKCLILCDCRRGLLGKGICNLIAEHFVQEMSHEISLQKAFSGKRVIHSHCGSHSVGNASCNYITDAMQVVFCGKCLM